MLLVEGGTLDEFVRAYCEANRIECDGGILSLYFSAKETFTEAEAVALINEAAKAYDLYLPSDSALTV